MNDAEGQALTVPAREASRRSCLRGNGVATQQATKAGALWCGIREPGNSDTAQYVEHWRCASAMRRHLDRWRCGERPNLKMPGSDQASLEGGER